ncbi:Ail/Lom family outer membrane beta-barrel protein [Dickeya undicola]|uniref:Ail/Lom family protein n=1 Tax=Dickeya undicola TaxID=1577887 RepID=A0A3N0G2W1_9GAMM|nr:Ail/Lom family outer membrane beta-barrel protein [Dickeya undicola]RNM06601.1 Ail/Lom family protein [Dickeya undicola]
MKKIVFSALLASGLLCGMSVRADMNTFSVGYAQSKIQDLKRLGGVNIQYRYEWDSALSLIGSFSYLSGDADASSPIENDVIRNHADSKYYSFLIGPAYRITPMISAYALLGAAHVKTDVSSEWFNFENSRGLVSQGTQKRTFTSNAFAYGAGIIINPINNLSVNLGYEGTQADINGDHAINGFTIGMGYRF